MFPRPVSLCFETERSKILSRGIIKTAEMVTGPEIFFHILNFKSLRYRSNSTIPYSKENESFHSPKQRRKKFRRSTRAFQEALLYALFTENPYEINLQFFLYDQFEELNF